MIHATRVVLGKLTVAAPVAAGALITAIQVDQYSSVLVTGNTLATTVYTLPAPTNTDIAANSQMLNIKKASTGTGVLAIQTVSGVVYIKSGRQETFYYDVTGAGWYAKADDEASVTKIEQALTIGGTNVFTHNRALADPLAYIYTLTHIATGHTVDVDLVSATANAVTFYSNTALTLCRLNIIG